MKLCPATVIVPVRGLVSELADTKYVIVPFPMPLLPEVIVIQSGLLLVAVHGQLSREEVTWIVLVPPVAENCSLDSVKL